MNPFQNSGASQFGRPQHTAPEAPAPAPAPSLPSQPAPTLLQGEAPSIVSSNTNGLRQSGLSELDAIKKAIGIAGTAKKKVSRHGNLGKFLHPRKDGRPHGSE